MRKWLSILVGGFALLSIAAYVWIVDFWTQGSLIGDDVVVALSDKPGVISVL